MNLRSEHLWGWVDRLLLLTVAGLMVAFHRDFKRLTAAVERSAEFGAVAEAPPTRGASPPEFLLAASRHTISVSPTGMTESRVSQVARSLSTEVGWEGAPVSQAADMRERNGLYDIALALPRQLDERSVQVTTDGNVLSLSASAISSPHAKFTRQFYIPCSSPQIGDVETTVSNGIVRIRIHPETF